MEEKMYELQVLKDKTLTKGYINVKRKELAKYLDKEYINSKIPLIDNNQERMLIIFLWMTGTRISEAIEVKKKDIDFNNKTIRISWLKNRKYSERNIPAQSRLLDMLRFYTGALNLEDRLFPFSRQNAWNITKKWFNCNPHTFRHSFAVNYLRQNGRIESLYKLLGHKNIKTTMEYLNIVPTDLGKDLEKIEF